MNILFQSIIFEMVILVSVVLCGASPPGLFLEEPSDQEVNPTDTVEMRCRLKPGAEKAQLLWRKDDQLVNTVNNPSYAVTGDARNNDFSIRINGVTVERDDGKWECQGFVAGGMVASRKAQLVVRQAPHDRPVMTRLGTDALLRNGEALLLRTDQNTTVVCEVRDANPPARIKWTVGPKDVSDFAHIINQTGPNSKLYNTISTLTYPYHPRDNQAQLKCDTIHAALTGSLSISAHLNVQYAPIIQFQQEPPGDISEGQDVVLSCVADANPPATVKWIVNNNEIPMLNATTIKIEGASHGSSGSYTCVASNEPVFPSPTRVSYSMAVRYPPSFVIQPQDSSADVSQDHTLFCDAEGHPPPRIQWLQKNIDGQTVVRGEERNLTIKIDYSSQGKYWCKASNTINNKDNVILSNVAELLVKGPPKFENLTSNSRLEVIGDTGGEATLTALYCSNPPPSSAYWMQEKNAGQRLKSQRIEPGTGSKKYDIRVKERSSGCYESRLTVSHLEVTDGGEYKYRVENDKGPNVFTTMLRVRAMMTIPTQYGAASQTGCFNEALWGLRSPSLAVCGGNITAERGSFALIRPPTGGISGNYSNNALCIWSISGPLDAKLRFTQESSFRFDIPESCNFDKLVIGCQQYCNGKPFTSEVVNASRVMVFFQSDENTSGRGFSVSVEAV